jgi:hypothetical protein
MPSTYTLISSNVLGSSAASVTFSAIPSTYTDLVVRFSARGSVAAEQLTLAIRVNSDTGTNYSYTLLYGTGSAAGSLNNPNNDYVAGLGNGNTSTSSTFSNGELYIPSYTASQNKPMSVSQVYENNATSARIHGEAGLWRSTSAITAISFTATSGTISADSSFYLYGIKNS